MPLHRKERGGRGEETVSGYVDRVGREGVRSGLDQD